jgi:WD repeat-containing protein 68
MVDVKRLTNSFADSYSYQHYPSISSSPQNPLQQQQLQSLPIRSAYYETHAPLFYSAWSRSSHSGYHTIAISSYKEDSFNKIEILEGSPELVEHANGSTSNGMAIRKFTDAAVELPVTKLQWDPSGLNKLATTTNVLTVWDIQENQLLRQTTMANKPDELSRSSHAPLTSFDWNEVSPNLVITSSIDTTCTVWDLNRPVFPKTQLIAHDSEVFDVGFIKGSTDIFASVGCDGSVRVFDLRCLEHSTIVYEPHGSTDSSTKLGDGSDIYCAPLLRLSTSNTDTSVLATFVAKSDSIAFIDMRYPGYATATLKGHNASVNSIQWHPTESKLLSGGDDCQALVWDMKESRPRHPAGLPESVYGDVMEINNVSWSAQGDWFGVVSGKGFQAVRP